MGTISQSVAKLCLERYDVNGGSGYPKWNHWGLYLDRSVAVEVLEQVAAKIEPLQAEFDVLCPIPTSGFPLAAFLLTRLQVPVLASFHWHDNAFHLESELLEFCNGLSRPVRVCAIDSVIHTGTSLFLCRKMVRERLKGEVTALVAIANNDCEPRDLIDPVKQEFQDEGRIHTIFTVSELLRLCPR